MLTALSEWLRSGAAWHLLPHDFPPWKAVDHYWRTWRLRGDWERLHAVVRERTRQRAGRAPTPRAGLVDSPSVKTTARGGPRAAGARTAARR